MRDKKKRCSWVKLDSDLSIDYHDNEWGVPCYDDSKLFELLILEGAQAGLSWHTILEKRENYRLAFDNFNVELVANYDEQKLNELLQNKGIVRNKAKLKSAITNARVFMEIQTECSSFSNYIWSFADNKVLVNHVDDYKDAPTKTPLSEKIAKDLKRRGMKFVGATIIYAYMQAIGMVNDHQNDCFCKQ